MRIRDFFKMALLFGLILFLAGCSGSQSTEKDEVKYGFLVAETGDIMVPLTPFDSLDPITTENMSYFYFTNLVYDGIYSLDKNYKPVLALGASEKLEGKSLVIGLKDGVSFHDGSLLTSSDVKYSLEHIIESKKGAYYSLISDSFTGKPALKCEVLDKKHLRFSWTGEGPMLREYLIFPITKPASDKDSMPYGTGPFKFVSYDSKKKLILEKYEFFHDETPSVSRVLGLVHDDENLIFTSLDTGRINVSTSWSKDFERFYNNDKFKADIFPSDKIHFIFLNPNGKLEDKRLRIGIYNAIDKNELIRDAMSARGVKTHSFMNPRNYMYKNVADEIDVDRSREIMSDLKLNLSIYFDWQNKTDLKIANFVNNKLTELGVKVNIVAKDSDTFEDYVKKVQEGNYDILISTAQINIIPDYLINLISGSSIPYNSDKINELKEAYRTASNNDDLEKVITTIDEFIFNDKTFIPLAYEENALIYKNSIIGEFESNYISPYQGLRSAYFTEKVESVIENKD